jgi:nucleotide-binding universal stress UspA family protein
MSVPEKEGRLQEISHRVLVERGEIWAVVSEVLTREKIDLIVMGTHGRTGLGILLLGSFAETVFRRARCPVLTVGPRTRPATPNLQLKNLPNRFLS